MTRLLKKSVITILAVIVAMCAMIIPMVTPAFAAEETGEEIETTIETVEETTNEVAAPEDIAPDAAIPEVVVEIQNTEIVENTETNLEENIAEEAIDNEYKDHEEYGTFVEWGYGNENQNIKWKTYEKDGVTTLVFSVVDDSLSAADKSVLQLLGEDGKTSVKDSLRPVVNQAVFEEGITGIGWMYLYDRSSYEPVYSSDYTVDKTKTDLFKKFTNLTTVVPCSTLERIGWSAFNECTNLENFDFSACPNIKEIMNQAFYKCNNLNVVDLSACSELETIAWSSFYATGKGSEVYMALPVHGQLKVIGGNAFYEFGYGSGASYDVDLSGNENLTDIMQSAFAGNSALTNIFLPTGDLQLPGNAFNRCATPFNNIRRAAFVDEYGVVYEMMTDGTAKLAYCPISLVDYTVPEIVNGRPVTAIANSAFVKATNLETIRFENASNITNVGNNTFQNVQSLKRVKDLATGLSRNSVNGAKALFGAKVNDSVFRNTGLGKVEVEEIEEVIVEEPIIEEPIVEEPIIEAPVVENPVVAPIENKIDETPVVETPAANTNETEIKENNAPAAAPVVEETGIEVPVVIADDNTPAAEEAEEVKAEAAVANDRTENTNNAVVMNDNAVPMAMAQNNAIAAPAQNTVVAPAQDNIQAAAVENMAQINDQDVPLAAPENVAAQSVEAQQTAAWLPIVLIIAAAAAVVIIIAARKKANAND